MKKLITILLLVSLFACQEKNNANSETDSEEIDLGEPEAISLLGQKLYPRELTPETKADFESKLNDTKMVHKAHPQDEMSIVWYGRRLAYLTRYKEAIDVYTKGLETNPDSYKILRHRGHRYISTRQFDHAIADLSRAAVLVEGSEPQLEPDGLPNRLNTPLSTTEWNIYYHLGLAYYLNGEFEKAKDTYLVCYEQSDNPDILVAATDWLYMIYRRLGDEESATALLPAIKEDMEIIENDSYYNRIMMYKGLATSESLLDVSENIDDISLALATQGYGVGNWHLYNGDTTEALNIYSQILKGNYWSAFGYIAAEADLARLE